MLTEKRAWDKLPDETSLSYKAFRAYLDQRPPRILIRTPQLANVSLNSVKAWVKRFRWYERADEYDNHIGRVIDDKKDDKLGAFRGQIMEQEQEDYAALHGAWSIVFKKVLSTPMDLDDTLNALKKLAQIRVIVDNMGRKASQMPNTYKSDEMERTFQDITPDTIELTINGPRILLTEGDDDAT